MSSSDWLPWGALTGVAILAVIVTLIAVFPASPVLVLADAVPGTGLIGAIVVLVCLTIVEFMPGKRAGDVLHRAGAIVMIAVGVVVWNLAMVTHRDTSISGSGPAAAANTTWQEMDEPRAVTEHGRWIALRDMLPEGGEAIFGENFFRADDHDAIAFWCEAARQQNLTLWVGVRVDEGSIRRGAIMRFDPQTCALPEAAPEIVHVAQWGIPSITGTWGRMEPLAGHSDGQADDMTASDGDASGGPDGDGPASTWLICYEAFLVRSWMQTPGQAGQAPDNRPIIVLSNDGAFSGGFPAAIGALPISRLRRKVTRAMAGLTGRTVLHAETGRTILVKGGSSRRVNGGVHPPRKFTKAAR